MNSHPKRLVRTARDNSEINTSFELSEGPGYKSADVKSGKVFKQVEFSFANVLYFNKYLSDLTLTFINKGPTYNAYYPPIGECCINAYTIQYHHAYIKMTRVKLESPMYTLALFKTNRKWEFDVGRVQDDILDVCGVRAYRVRWASEKGRW